MAEFVDYGSLNDAIGLTSDAKDLGSITGLILPYVLTIAGLILFGMLIMGGFTMLTGAADKHAQETGKAQITSALIGFIIIFLSYWIAQILQVIFQINILS